jgi:hypothetical protein
MASRDIVQFVPHRSFGCQPVGGTLAVLTDVSHALGEDPRASNLISCCIMSNPQQLHARPEHRHPPLLVSFSQPQLARILPPRPRATGGCRIPRLKPPLAPVTFEATHFCHGKLVFRLRN